MDTRVSHYVIGWNLLGELTPIPVLGRTKLSDGIDIFVVESNYDAAEARDSTLYLVKEEDFTETERFRTFKINEDGNGWPSMTCGCWIVDHLIVSESLGAIQQIVRYLVFTNKSSFQ